jgi:putative membrane protein
MTSRIRHLPWLFAAATVAIQIPYPLLHGDARQAVTIASVATFCAATLTHIGTTRGPLRAIAFGVAISTLAFAIEVLGVHTHVPFGHYAYDGGLGPSLAGVPLLIGLAWTMMAAPAVAAARRITDRTIPGAARNVRRAITVGIVAIALAGWDLFLDPQMVADGYWHWFSESAALQGIPWTNLTGWLLAGTAIGAMANAMLPPAEAPAPRDELPLALFGWTYVGSIVVNAAFLDRPGVALDGGIGMGLVAIPLLWVLAVPRVPSDTTNDGARHAADSTAAQLSAAR